MLHAGWAKPADPSSLVYAARGSHARHANRYARGGFFPVTKRNRCEPAAWLHVIELNCSLTNQGTPSPRCRKGKARSHGPRKLGNGRRTRGVAATGGRRNNQRARSRERKRERASRLWTRLNTLWVLNGRIHAGQQCCCCCYVRGSRFHASA
jgi:hypothetical protein